MTDHQSIQSKETTVRARPSLLTTQPSQSIRNRLLLASISLIIFAITIITAVAIISARNVSLRAQQISGQSLNTQALDYLEQINSSAANEIDLILDRSTRNVQSVADTVLEIYTDLGPTYGQGDRVFWPVDEHMFVSEDGQFMNSEADITSVLVPNFKEIDEAVVRDIELGGYLEFIMEGIAQNNPNMEALYLATPNEVTRYYPNIMLGAVVPPDFQVTGRPWYVESETFNKSLPDPKAVWTSPYQDATGLGLVTTVAIPVYDDLKILIGVVGMDITLNEVSNTVQQTQILDTGYSFLIDEFGKVIFLPEQGYLDILGRPENPDEFAVNLLTDSNEFSAIIDSMVQGDQGVSSVVSNDKNLFVAYAPLPSTGWSLGSVVSADEVYLPVTALQQALTQTTVSLILGQILPVVLAISALLIVMSLIWTNRLMKPVQELATAAQKIGLGQWDINVPVRNDDELGVLAHTLNTMTAQLRATFGELEQRVVERTRQLEHRSLQLQIASEVARDITTAENLDELLNNAVRLIAERFDFYSVNLFLNDDQHEYTYLTAGSGEASEELHKSRVRIRIGHEGIVGHAISYSQPRVASDVRTDSEYLEFPLLPETRSEVALPLRVSGIAASGTAGSNTIGALDVQSSRAGAFEQEDLIVLQTLADQLATAIENIRLVERLQTTLHEADMIYGRQVQKSWALANLQTASVFVFDQVQVKSIDGAPSQRTINQSAAPGRLTIPVSLREQVIGYIELESDDPDYEWSADEIAIAEATANQAAITLENARLLAETQRQAEREQMMGIIAMRVRETLNLESVLQTTIREIGQVMNIDEIDIQLGQAPSSKRKEAKSAPSGRASEDRW